MLINILYIQKLNAADVITDINKIPHTGAKRVDCSVECHIKQPETNENFSHKDVAEIFKKSVHNPLNSTVGNTNTEDFPSCTDCHHNPVYPSIEEELKRIHNTREDAEVVRKCSACHKEPAFYAYFFRHIVQRTGYLFSKKESIDVCVKCHSKESMVKSHKLKNAGATYFDTFHGKAALFGLPNAPTCIDCHVKENDSPHLILSHKNKNSVTSDNERYKACKKSGCHPNATKNMGNIRMHVVIDKDMYPAEYYTALGFSALTLGAFFPLMLFLILELIREIFPNFKIRKDK